MNAEVQRCNGISMAYSVGSPFTNYIYNGLLFSTKTTHTLFQILRKYLISYLKGQERYANLSIWDM